MSQTFEEWVQQFQGWWANKNEPDDSQKSLIEVLYRAARDGWRAGQSALLDGGRVTLHRFWSNNGTMVSGWHECGGNCGLEPPTWVEHVTAIIPAQPKEEK
jgi:hypothetical protein